MVNKTVKRLLISIAIIIPLIIILSSTLYTVREDEVAVVKRLGRIDRVVVDPRDSELIQNGIDNKNINTTISTKKGLNYKIPFIETVEKYNAKYLTYISESATINTFDSRRIDLTMFAQYRIVNPALFDMTMGNIRNSMSLMDDRVYSAVIQLANTFRFNEFFDKSKITVALDEKRDELNKSLTMEFGIYIVDIGIFRKNFPQANIAAIEEKMTQEIQKESEKLRAEGDSLLRQSKAETDRKKKETVATAMEEAAIIKAEADAEAARIVEEALKVDLEFYRFISRMESYKNLKDTTVFIDNSNDFINYINNLDN